MNPVKTAKAIKFFESGLVSAAEVAHSLLYDLMADSSIDRTFLSKIDSLPDEVANEFLRLLKTIEEADFNWSPFLLSAPTVHSDTTTNCAKLRQICAWLK